MRSSTAYNWQVEFLRIVEDAFGSARSFHMSHADTNDRIVERVYKHHAWDRVPATVRAYVSAVIACRFDDMYKYHTEWRINWRGSLVRSDDILPGTWSECDGGSFVYKDRPDRIW